MSCLLGGRRQNLGAQACPAWRIAHPASCTASRAPLRPSLCQPRPLWKPRVSRRPPMCTGASAADASTAAMSEGSEKAPKLPLSLADFELLRRVGDGSYSHVVLARHRETGREYALKVVDKQYILRHKVVEYIRKERQILDCLRGHPGVAALHFTFQDAYSLYLGLEFCPNGELYDQIRLRGKLEEADARFYAAEVVLMLEFLREHRVVHRDLKPENLLLDESGHLKLIDFGSAKLLPPEEVLPAAAAAADQAGTAAPAAAAAAADGVDGTAAAAAGAQQEGEQGQEGDDGSVPGAADPTPSSSSGGSAAADGGTEQSETAGQEAAAVSGQAEAGGSGPAGEGQDGRQEEEGSGEASPSRASKRQVSLVGTADYVSPEILNNQPVSCAADLWALGCVLFQMFAGRPPFKSPSEYLTFQRIVEAEYRLPEGLPPAAADLIGRLLVLEPSQRIGARDLGELKAHPFFEGIGWDTLRSQPAPEFVPDMADGGLSSASSSFDWELQSLASALPPAQSDDHLELE